MSVVFQRGEGAFDEGCVRGGGGDGGYWQTYIPKTRYTHFFVAQEEDVRLIDAGEMVPLSEHHPKSD